MAVLSTVAKTIAASSPTRSLTSAMTSSKMAVMLPTMGLILASVRSLGPRLSRRCGCYWVQFIANVDMSYSRSSWVRGVRDVVAPAKIWGMLWG